MSRKKMKKKSPPIPYMSVRLRPGHHDLLTDIAEADHRSLTASVGLLIEGEGQRRGVMAK